MKVDWLLVAVIILQLLGGIKFIKFYLLFTVYGRNDEFSLFSYSGKRKTI